MEGVCCGLNVNTQFLEGIGRASWRRWYLRSAGRSRLLDLKKSVDASRHRGVVRIALSSPEWGGPKGENRKERDGTSECYRWLAKDDLMTKTGYGYAKCLTVAGTATASGVVWALSLVVYSPCPHLHAPGLSSLRYTLRWERFVTV